MIVVSSQRLIDYVHVLLFDQWQEHDLPIVSVKLNNYLIPDLWPCVEYSNKVLFPYGMSLYWRWCLINKFKSLIITNLMTTNDTIFSKLLSKIKFLIYFITNIVAALLNIENLIAFSKLICYHKIGSKLPIFKAIKNLDHEFAVNIIPMRIEWKLYSKVW